jgi:hypothetical protein
VVREDVAVDRVRERRRIAEPPRDLKRLASQLGLPSPREAGVAERAPGEPDE